MPVTATHQIKELKVISGGEDFSLILLRFVYLCIDYVFCRIYFSHCSHKISEKFILREERFVVVLWFCLRVCSSWQKKP